LRYHHELLSKFVYTHLTEISIMIIHKVLICVACSLLLTLAGCGSVPFPRLYKLDVRQGNYIDQAAVEQLQLGMSKRQVQLLLGSPLLTDPFHEDRWDYIYRYSPRGKLAEQRRATLYFEGELLSRIESDFPDAPP